MYPEVWDEWQTQFNPVGVGADVARQVAIYHRWATIDDGTIENFAIVLNFSDADQAVRVPLPTGGRWSDLLNDDEAFDVRADALVVEVGSNWGHVLKRSARL